MGGFRDLASAAEGNSVYGNDDGLWKGFDARRHRLPPAYKGPHRRIRTVTKRLRKFRDIGASRKGPLTCAGQNHGADVGITLDRIEQLLEPVDQRVAQRIELFRPVERQDRNRVTTFAKYQFRHLEALGFS